MLHGFRQQLSFEAQLVGFIDDITRNNDNHGLLAGLGKVSCSLFIHELNQYGIKGKTNAWTNGLFSDSSQCVVIEGELSDIIKVESGISPGSIVGH